MSRIQNYLDQLKQSGRSALIPFITAGDPNPEFTVPAMHALVEAGADIIELGVPFSDPMADGPVIQKASERALVHKMSLRRVLQLVSTFREQNQTTPVVLMGYLNPIESLGYRPFAEQARDAGVDGVLTVDLPPEESAELAPLLREVGVDIIYLLAPNSTEDRIRLMGQLGSGYLYYVSLKGVTGASHLDLAEVESRLSAIRQLTDLPIGVGFGVKNAETAGALARLADAVVVGSALVGSIESHPNDPSLALAEMTTLIRSMRSAMDASV
ncbi:MAG: tryptophan synthase subunit alpha [Methylococcaceae bacterium]